MNSKSISITRAAFQQREERRAALFLDIWTRRVPKVFEDVPPYYRLGNIVASLGLWELWVWQFVRTIDLKPGDKVLDLCAGTNDIGIRLLKKRGDISVTALDRSAEMQEKGRQDAEKRGFHIHSVVQDAHALPFADGSFDVVTLQAASRHLRMSKVLPEVLRVLKPGGRFYHCDMLRPACKLIRVLYLGYLSLALPVTAAIFGASPESRTCNGYFAEAIDRFYTAEELTEILHLTGFENVACKKSIWCGMVAFHRAQKAEPTGDC